MNLPWFRLYTEFLTDPLIRMLAPGDRAHFIDVLCMKALGVLDKEYSSDALRNAVISRYVGVTGTVTGNDNISQLDATRDRLLAHVLIVDRWQPINWEKRQFQKDARDPTGAERQRRHREKHAETLRNVTVTSIEQIQNRTDKDKTPVVPKGDVERVFWHWQEVHRHPQAKLDSTRQRLIAKRLKDFSANDLCIAINGYKRSKWHQGENERHQVFDAIELILRDSAHIEGGIRMANGEGGAERWV